MGDSPHDIYLNAMYIQKKQCHGNNEEK